MPLTYRIYHDSRLLFIRGEGVVTQRERLQTMQAWLADPAYPDCIDALCDFTATQSTPRLADLRELVAMLRTRVPASGPTRLAVVTARPIAFAVARVFGNLVQVVAAIPLEVQVFMDREVAWGWLRQDGADLSTRIRGCAPETLAKCPAPGCTRPLRCREVDGEPHGAVAVPQVGRLYGCEEHGVFRYLGGQTFQQISSEP